MSDVGTCPSCGREVPVDETGLLCVHPFTVASYPGHTARACSGSGLTSVPELPPEPEPVDPWGKPLSPRARVLLALAPGVGGVWVPELNAVRVATRADGLHVDVGPLLFTYAVLLTEPDGVMYRDRWCYADATSALLAAATWQPDEPEPTGWHRHPSSGRRRDGGDPATEEVSR